MISFLVLIVIVTLFFLLLFFILVSYVIVVSFISSVSHSFTNVIKTRPGYVKDFLSNMIIMINIVDVQKVIFAFKVFAKANIESIINIYK